MTEIANTEQAEFWSGDAGDAWVRKQAFFDALLDPVLAVLTEKAQAKPGETLVDIGCGTGASLLKWAHDVGASGRVVGADVSVPMLEMAKWRVSDAGLNNVECHRADAQIFDFSRCEADLLVSRFGVMFFEKPYAAFSNLVTALRPEGRMIFATWDSISDNPWFWLPAEAAKAEVGAPPPPVLRAPGPMAFSERDYVCDILEQAGLTKITAQPVDLFLTPLGSVSEVAQFASAEGPASRIMREMGGTEADAARVSVRLDAAFSKYDTAQGVRVPARINLFSAFAAD